MLVEVMYVSNERNRHGKEEVKIKCTHTALHYSHLALVFITFHQIQKFVCFPLQLRALSD
jgi:hypothetical protein